MRWGPWLWTEPSQQLLVACKYLLRHSGALELVCSNTGEPRVILLSNGNYKWLHTCWVTVACRQPLALSKPPFACMVKWAACHRKFDACGMTNVCLGCRELNSIVDLQEHQNTIKGWHQTREPREFLRQKGLNLKVQGRSALVGVVVQQFVLLIPCKEG